MALVEKKTKGKQRIPMVRMEKQSNRLVTFSKRRAGLFKKASELCIMCGVEAAVIVFSPGRKAFSFGHPSADATIERYYQSILNHPPTYQIGEPSNQPALGLDLSPRLSLELMLIRDQSDVEKKRYEAFINARKEQGEEYHRWLTVLEESRDLQELKAVRDALVHLMNNVQQYYDEYKEEYDNNPNAIVPHMGGQNFAPNDYFGGHIHHPSHNQMGMVPNDLGRGPYNYDPAQMMIVSYSPMEGGKMRANAIAMDLLNANTNSTLDTLSHSPHNHHHPLAQPPAHQNPNFMSPFRGEYNPIGSGRFSGFSPYQPFHGTSLANFQAGPSMPTGPNGMLALPAPPLGPNDILALPAPPSSRDDTLNLTNPPPAPRGMLALPAPPAMPNGVDAEAPHFNLRGGYGYGDGNTMNSGFRYGTNNDGNGEVGSDEKNNG